MSVCTFLASDFPLAEFKPSQEYPFHADVDSGTIYDGNADDNFFLQTFNNVQFYTDKKYGVYLDWAYYTDGRARKILDYIKNVLEQTDDVELWHVWLTDYYEYDDRPIIQKRNISFREITVNDIKELDSQSVLNYADKRNPNRPTFYCLKITR